MPSPAQRHFMRMSAKAVSAEPDGSAPANSNAYELMLAKLHADRARLKDVQSIERKIQVKRELLPDYEPWVTGVLESGRGAQDDVLTTVLVWYVDTGDFRRALDVARYVLKHGLTLPDQYDRNVATMLADEISDTALALLRADGPDALLAEYLEEALDLLAERDMPDQAKAKIFKAAGLAVRDWDREKALARLRRALELHEGSGVKRDIATIESELKKSGQTPEN